jgi:hypothetical protein
MTNQQHPITPPPELVQQWVDVLLPNGSLNAFTIAAQYGADQELEACHCEVTFWGSKSMADRLQAVRRPHTPPSLKNRALKALGHLTEDEPNYKSSFDTIRLALETLPND